jgi:hypothetical protein
MKKLEALALSKTSLTFIPNTTLQKLTQVAHFGHFKEFDY